MNYSETDTVTFPLRETIRLETTPEGELEVLLREYTNDALTREYRMVEDALLPKVIEVLRAKGYTVVEPGRVKYK